MRRLSRGAVFLVALNVIASFAVVALGAKLVVVPMVMRQVYKEQYKRLMFQCDEVMRNHFIAKGQAVRHPSKESFSELRAAEVGLLSCHDYDKLRKRLQTFGVTEAELSSLGLEAIEDKAKDVRIFVETHEVRY